MNKLSNISPFIVLLVPVFVMMIFAFTKNIQPHTNKEEAALKTTVQSPSMIAAAFKR